MRRKDSLGPGLVLTVVVLITAVTIALGGSAVLLERRLRRESLFGTARATADFAARTLAYPVWNIITREIEVQLELTFRDESVRGAVLRLEDVPLEAVSYTRDPTGNVVRGVPAPEAEWFSEKREVVFNGRTVAVLELYFTEELVSRRVRTEALSIALIVLVVDGILALALLAILRKAVFLPLERIERWASSLDFSDDSVPAIGEDGVYRGEIASLGRSIGRMVGLLNERYATILSKEREYRSLFETSPVSIWELDFSAVRERLGADSASCESLESLTFMRDPGRARGILSLVRIKSVNRITLEWLGLPSLEAVQRGMRTMLHDDAIQLFLKEIRCLSSCGDGAAGECRLRLPSGENRSYMVRFATLAGYEETWTRVVLTAVDITERARAEADLVMTIAQKDALVQELFHRTRNSLQLISSMIYLREPRVAEAIKGELRGLRNRINTIALAHDKLYESGDLTGISARDYLRDLAGSIRQGYGALSQRIRLDVEATDRILLIDVAIPLGIVVCELLVNSFSYGFPGERSGTVEVRLDAPDPKALRLVVSDDGVGPGPDFDPRRDAGVGLDMVFAVGEGQLRGKIDFDFSAGFACSLAFPLPEIGRRI